MNLVLYSDVNYQYQVRNFIASLKYGGIEDCKIIYYTIDFESDIDDPRVVKVPMQKDPSGKKFEFYKPMVCLDALKYGEGQFLYFDADIMLSKRFKDLEIQSGLNYPGFCTGPIEYPHTFWQDNEGKKTIFNESRLMNYLGVKERSMPYIMTCFFAYDSLCSDFLEEWQSFCENKYLLKEWYSWYAFTDETIANVLLWKRQATANYGRRFINTHKFSTFKLCEENDQIFKTFIDNNIYEQCEDSGKVCFYHATKIKEENEKILNYIHENS
jgi:hypothetical protein